MTLAEIEALARECVDPSPGIAYAEECTVDTVQSLIGHAVEAVTDRAKLARFIVAAMPVVRAAEALHTEWRDTSGSASNVDAITERCHLVANAIDAMRAALESP